jgi:hypothetical protein
MDNKYIQNKIKELLLLKSNCDEYCICNLCYIYKTCLCKCKNLTNCSCKYCGNGICKDCSTYSYLCLDEDCIDIYTNYFRC